MASMAVTSKRRSRRAILTATCLLVASASMVAASTASLARNHAPTCNPWNKESPDPCGYDVYTAPDLPLGFVDPEDPPAILEPRPPLDSRFAVLSVMTSVDRNAYSWFGTITVTAEVARDGSPLPDCDSVVVVSAANPRVRGYLADDGILPDLVAGDGRYAGYFEIGAGVGEARPTGNYTATAYAYRGAEGGSGVSPSFSLYSVRRWTGITTGGESDPSDQYTDFFVTSNGPGMGHHHTIRDLGLIRSTSVTDAQIRIPVFPAANEISGLDVTGTGVSGVALRGNVIAFTCNLSSATVTRVTIEFDAPSDLAAVFIDRYHTGDIGLRDFRNGYLVWNRYVHTGILGSGFTTPHGPGCIVDEHVTDLETGDAHTIDCMERVAFHLDNAAFNDGTGTYPSNVKWGGDALSWLVSGDLQTMRFRFFSGGTYGLANKVAVDRRVEFFAESRLFHHRYLVRNIDQTSHDFDFVWGREQWLYGSAPGSNRQADDRGLLPNDEVAYGGEHGRTPAQLDGNWFAAFDRTSFYSIGVLSPRGDGPEMPDYAYFLCDPPLGSNYTGEYPIVPSESCADMGNLFFEERFGTLAPGDSVAYDFYQWGGYGSDRRELTEILWRDAVTLSGEPLALEYGPLGDGVPVSAAIDLRFNNPMNQTATEAAFRLTPHVSGTFEWSDGDRQLRFRPAGNLDPLTVYRAEVLRTALDQAGRALASAADWSFETSDDPMAAPGVSTRDTVFALRQPAPNPFTRSTMIVFELPAAGHSRLAVFDAKGREAAVLVDRMLPAGVHAVSWNGDDPSGRSLPSGIYFCRLELTGREEARKITLRR